MRPRSAAGFTLTELVVAAAVTFAVLAPLAWVLAASFRAERSLAQELDLTGQALILLRRTEMDIRASAGRVSFRMAGDAQDRSGLRMKDGRIVAYTWSAPGEVRRTVHAAGDRAIAASEVVARHLVSFSMSGDALVTVAIALESATVAASARTPFELTTDVEAHGW